MTIKNISLTLSLFITLSSLGYSQESGTNIFNVQSLESIDKDLLYSLVILQDKDGNYSTGFLIGLKSDTLVLHEMDKNKNFPIQNLVSISIETRRKSGMRGVASGGILGTYLFYLAFWQTANEPFAYYDNEQPTGQAADDRGAGQVDENLSQ